MSTVPYRTNSYGFYLSNLCALIGVDQADLQSTELTFMNVFFNRALRKIWEMQTWTDLCPPAEVRFVSTNLVTYPNDLSQTSTWSLNTGVTVTPNAAVNPLDNRMTATAVYANATSAPHYVSGLCFLNPNQGYTISGYFQPAQLSYLSVFISEADGAFFRVFFNCNQPTPTVGAVTQGGGGTGGLSFPNPTGTISACGNGFYLWSVSWTSTTPSPAYPMALAQQAQYEVALSSAGNDTSFLGAGTALPAAYMWGISIFAQQNLVPAQVLIPFTQAGETAIDTVFEVYCTNPGGPFIGQRVNYILQPNGIQILGPITFGYVYVYYRPQRPAFAGSQWSASLTYSAGQSMYYTTTAGTLNYYTCVTATTAGQSPDTTPASWQVIYIPDVLFQYIVHNAYGDWLQTEGQTAKAQLMYEYAQSCVDDENDKQERQNGNIQPWRVNTHITSQNRGMGFQSQNFSPNGTVIIN